MFHFNTLFEFSSANCVAICAFLVPANLLLTLHTMILTGLRRPQRQVRSAVILACIPAVAMVFHVCAWWAMGVVMAPTFILLALASTCLSINFWAIANPQNMVRLFVALLSRVQFAVGASSRR